MVAYRKLKSAAARKARVFDALKTSFGFRNLRPLQLEVIDSVLSGHATLAIMPTGSGKSLCYQIPSVLLSGTTLVVSPLIALMKDQKEKMDHLHIEAVELNSSLAAKVVNDGLERVSHGEAKIVYVTPERLSKPEFIDSLRDVKIDLFVLDEAHCLTQWGHDFRPSYLGIREAWSKLGEPTFLALTATATHEVVEDLKAQMQLPALKVFHSGVLRKNLTYEAFLADSEAQKLERLLELVENLREKEEGSGIIYCSTVKGVEEIFSRLEEAGISAVRYHGKLSAKARTANQEAFMSGAVPIIVATNAFGMGIDKPDIRSVIHFNFPGSLEAYYQESGRAGRDGKSARCVLLYLKADKRTQSFFLAGKYPSATDVKSVYLHLAQGGSLDSITSVSKTKSKVVYRLLKEEGVLNPKRRSKTPPRPLSSVELESLAHDYIEKAEHDRSKLKQMIIYAQSALCRWKIIIDYFEQQVEWALCQHCDNCLHAAAKLAQSLPGENRSTQAATV